jgi:type VI secretion system protein ImpC
MHRSPQKKSEATILPMSIPQQGPRVKITYDIETNGILEKRELPFKIGILADLSGHARSKPALKDRQWQQVDRETLSSLMQRLGPDTSADALYASWAGLQYLVCNVETGSLLEFHVLDLTKQELSDDLNKAVDLDQSEIFKKIYESSYGTYGGAPFSLLLGDYYFSGSNPDTTMLQKIASLAAAAHAPFIAAADAALFGMDDFKDLNKPRSLQKIFESVELVGYMEFRETEDARYVSLALPKILVDIRHDKQPSDPVKAQPVQIFNAEEIAERCVWGNPAYLLAERIAHSFSTYSWPAAFVGEQNGALELPAFSYTDADDKTHPIGPAEVAIRVDRGQELCEWGFIPVCQGAREQSAVFYHAASTNRPKKYFSEDANQHAELSATLPYLLTASRFAHYIKVIMRDMVGSFMTRANVEAYLNTWISQYILLDDNASAEAKAAYPLRQAQVVVTDTPGQPGSYRATVFLKPHFQLEELTTSIRLVAELPA